MRKKFLPLLIAVFLFFIPFSSVFAATISKLSVSSYSYSGGSNAGMENLFDDNDSTTFNISGGKYIIVYLPTNSYVDNIKIRNISNDAVLFRTIDKNGTFSGYSARNIAVNNLNTIYVQQNAKGFVIEGGGGNSLNIASLSFHGYSLEVSHENIVNLSQAKDYKSARFTWTNPAIPEFNGVKVFRDDVAIATLDKDKQVFSDSGLNASTTYKYKFVSMYTDGIDSTGVTTTVTTEPLPPEISDLIFDADYKTIKFSWVNPTKTEFDGIKIFRNDVPVVTLERSINTFNDFGLTASTTYKYKFVAIYTDGYETNGIAITPKTTLPPPVEKVKGVNVSTTYNRVNLSWTLPEQEGLKHVNIYREKIEEEPGFFESIFSLSGTKVYAAEPKTKIFETNGTYFNDLTVIPSSEYEYTLTTQTVDGRESEGVNVNAKTTEEPKPVLKDGTYTLDENGDYILKWSEPTKGQVKVLIDDNLYKSVEASQLQLVVPKNDMKYTLFGDPKVSFIPISEYRTEGDKVTIGGGLIDSFKLPFDVTDLLQTIMGIIGLVAPFILLTLVIYYFKPIKDLIVRAAHRIRKGEVKNE
jgi:hypothetical protein